MVSIIIPTLNEASIIETTLSNIQKQEGKWEIIVTDGGSTDATLRIAQTFPEVLIINAPKGRAVQMNEGARKAKGSVLLFLHADTFLPPSAILFIEKEMNNSKIVAGSFYLKFDKDNLALKLYSLFSRINHLLFTYGDQAIFVRKEVFENLNGYKAIPLMEDVEIQKRLRKAGKFIKIKNGVTTSSRRFIRKGIIFQQIQNIILVILFLAGISPKYLKNFYRNEGEHQDEKIQS